MPFLTLSVSVVGELSDAHAFSISGRSTKLPSAQSLSLEEVAHF